MSINCGFALRKIEEEYNKLVGRLILLLQSDVLKLMSPDQTNKRILHRKTLDKYKEVFQRLEIFEEHRYLEPKFSHLCSPLKNLISNGNPKILMQMAKSQRKSKSQNKTKQNEFNEDLSVFQSQKNSIRRINETMAQLSNKQFQSKHHQLNKSKVKNEPFSIFTIQEVSENVSRKGSIKKNNRLIEIPKDSLDFKFKQKKMRIYKSYSKYRSVSQSPKHNNDEPFFPSYRKLSSQSIKDQHNEQKLKQLEGLRNQSHYQQNKAQNHSIQRIPNFTVNFTMNQTYLSSQLQTVHKMKTFTMTQQQKPVKKVQKGSQFVKMRYKKLIDRQNFQKIYVKKKT